MRVFLTFTAILLSILIAVQFAGDPVRERPFSNMTIVVLASSDSQGHLENAIGMATDYIEMDLGCIVEVENVDWDPDRELTTFRNAMSAIPSGICVTGYPSYDALLPEIEEAVDLEIAVTGFNDYLGATEERFRSLGFGFVGIDAYQAGYDLVKAAIARHQLGPDSNVMLMGDLENPARAPFRDGCLAAFHEGGVQVTRRIITSRALNMDEEAVTQEFRAMAQRDTLPDLICFTEIPLRILVRILEAARIETEDQPILIGIGMNPEQESAQYFSFRDDTGVSMIAEQDVALNLYLAIVQACMYSAYQSPGLHITTPTRVKGRGLDSGPKSGLHAEQFIVLN
jgi:simple sugar transport system substrate-binding protein